MLLKTLAQNVNRIDDNHSTTYSHARIFHGNDRFRLRVGSVLAKFPNISEISRPDSGVIKNTLK